MIKQQQRNKNHFDSKGVRVFFFIVSIGNLFKKKIFNIFMFANLKIKKTKVLINDKRCPGTRRVKLSAFSDSFEPIPREFSELFDSENFNRHTKNVGSL